VKGFWEDEEFLREGRGSVAFGACRLNEKGGRGVLCVY